MATVLQSPDFGYSVRVLAALYHGILDPYSEAFSCMLSQSHVFVSNHLYDCCCKGDALVHTEVMA